MYKCHICGRAICAKHAKFTITCINCASKDEKIDFSIREATVKDREVIGGIVKNFWGEDVQLTFGKKFLVKKLPVFAAVVDGNIVGFISYYNLN